MKDNQEDIQEFLNNLSDKFDIMEEGIDVQTQLEYIDNSHTLGSGELTEKETMHLGSILFNKNLPPEAKKKALTLLAHLGTIIAFRIIEKYYKNPENELKQWTALALQECKMFLENTLTDENTGFISSGLGGLKDKLRYYFMLLPLSDAAFTPIQKNIIKAEFTLIAKDLNCIVESANQSDEFAGLTALVPMDVAVGTLIENGIKKCNELGDFVFEHYYVTNQNIPDKPEIDEIIRIVRSD